MNDIVNGIYESWFSKDYPKNWNISRVKDLISIIRKEKNKYENTPVLSLTIDGVKLKKHLNEGMNPETYIGHQLVYPGDLVICLRDLDGPLLVGISEYYGCTSNLYLVLQFSNHNLEYYNYVFKTMDFLRVIDDFSYGMRHSYNISQFGQLRLPEPKLHIQSIIVEKLNFEVEKIDKLIDNQQQQIEKLKEYKQSLISEVVTKGLNPNVKYKDSGINWIGYVPQDWKVLQLRRIGKLLNGSTPKSDNSLFWDGEIFWATPSDFTEKQKIENTSRKITELGYSSCNTTLVPKGSILITCRAPIGNVAINEVAMCFNQGCKAIVSSSDNRYLYYFLKSMNEPLNIHGQGTTFQEISTNSLKNFIITLPNEEERKIISNYLDEKSGKIDLLINNKKDKIQLLENYKKSLIYEYVTGKKEVS